MRVRALLVVVLVVLAGCSGGAPDSLATGDGTATDTPTVDADNPWRERTLSVMVEPTEGDRDYRPLVREALDYWERNAEEYAGYPVSFELVSDRADADIVVEFVDEVTGCEDVKEAAGCAPYVTKPAQIDRPETLEVVTGLTDESTVLVLKHEFGHVLGLNHEDAPQSVMSATEELTTLPKPDASERPIPWKHETLTVFVDYSGVSAADRETVRDQVHHALDYYDRGADGHVPENVSFVLTSNRSMADIIITFPDSAPCSDDEGSCGYRYGADPDGDGEAEWYEKAEIAVSGIDAEAVGWHVGYWLGYALGFTDPGDWPDAFRNASASERRSDWWNGDTYRRMATVATA